MSILTKALCIALAVLLALSLVLGFGTWYYKGAYERTAAELAQVRANYRALVEASKRVQQASTLARARSSTARAKVQADPEAQEWARQELPQAVQEALK